MTSTAKINLDLKKAKNLDVGASKIGGLPSVPADFEWPQSEYDDGPLGYVLQINLAELQAASPTPALPKKGVLQLYCSLDESDLSSPEPSHAVVFHEDPSKLVEGELPESLDADEANLEQRAISFGKGDGARMFGDAPELTGDLEGAFDEAKEELLLELDAYNNVTRVGASHSIFGEGRFVLCITKSDLKKGKLEEAALLFVGGS
jgi:hypothetical protein